jgi:CDP-glucose 4,6-dehydratase
VVLREGALASMGLTNPSRSFWESKSVFVTGHTGFKGGWLSLFLKFLGAKVHGYSLAPITDPSFFELTSLEQKIDSSDLADVCNLDVLRDALRRANPDVILHLAAQPLVRRSYADPIQTYQTNVLGTVNLLHAARECRRLKSVVVVTSDKCYENYAWPWGYRETDTLGGHDPYSSSKACQELIVAGFRSSYLAGLGISVATARAGNVIGGGDWSEDRLIPDAIRAHAKRESLVIRNPGATRPWQHVLEPVSAYLLLAQRLYSDGDLSSAWNFGPFDQDVRTVEQVLTLFSKGLSGGLDWKFEKPDVDLHEARLLKLDCSKAQAVLDWEPRWRLEEAVRQTCNWYNDVVGGVEASSVTYRQIKDYYVAGAQ